jgi:hypothetical protein
MYHQTSHLDSWYLPLLEAAAAAGFAAGFAGSFAAPLIADAIAAVAVRHQQCGALLSLRYDNLC